MLDLQTLAIMGTIAGAAITSALWLSSRLNAIERLVYKEMDKHSRDDNARFDEHGRRIQRLELKEFGFTHTP